MAVNPKNCRAALASQRNNCDEKKQRFADHLGVILARAWERRFPGKEIGETSARHSPQTSRET